MPRTTLSERAFSTIRLEDSYYGMQGGINVKSLQQQMQDDELSAGQNGYLRADGGFEMRRGFAKLFATAIAGGGVIGGIRFYQLVVAGAALAAPLATTLIQIGGNLFNAATQVQIGANGALGASAQPWSAVRVFDPDIAGGGGDACVICTGSGGPYLVANTPLTITTPAGWAGVAGARWCQVVNGVLFFGGLPSQPNSVVAMVEGHPETQAAVFTCSTTVTGLGVLGAGVQSALVVGLNRGLVLLVGTGPDNYAQSEIAHEDGVAAGRTMINVRGLLYFLGGNGIYVFDGGTITPVSKNVQPWIENDPLAVTPNDFPMDPTRRNAWAIWYLNRLHIFYPLTGATTPNTALVLNLDVEPAPGRGWTVLQLGKPLMSGWLLDSPGNSLNLGADPLPHAMQVGSATQGFVYNWDVNNGTGDNVDDDGAVIQAIVISKFFKLYKPGVVKKVWRVYYELYTEAFSGQVGLYTDYGGSSFQQLVNNLPGNPARFDIAQFDMAKFAGGKLSYSGARRIDWGLPAAGGAFGLYATRGIAAEAFAYGVQSTDQNPPWRFAGCTTEYTVEPRR